MFFGVEDFNGFVDIK